MYPRDAIDLLGVFQIGNTFVDAQISRFEFVR